MIIGKKKKKTLEPQPKETVAEKEQSPNVEIEQKNDATEAASKQKGTKIIKRTVKRVKKSEEEKEIETGLKEIYEEGGEIPDMSKLERRTGRWWLAAVFVFLFLVSVAATIYAGWVFWKPWEKPKTQGLKLEILGPTQVKNGESTIYKILFQNLEKVPMANVEIRANLPKEITVLSLTPEPTQENYVWQVGSLNPGESGEIKMQAYFLGEIKTSLNLQALADFKPANFSSEFQEINTLSVLLTDSLTDLVVSGPSKAVPGEEIEYEVKFKNTSEFDYGEVEIQAQYPDNFIFTKSEPETLGDSDNRWLFNALTTGTEEIIKIRGSFSAQGQGLQNLIFIIGSKQGNGFRLLKQESIQTEVLAGDLVLHLLINGSETNQNIDLGENLRLSLTYDNTSGEDMENIELKVHIESNPTIGSEKLVVWQNLQMPDDKKGRIGQDSVTWNKDNFEALEKIEKDSEGIIDFSLPVVNEPLSSVQGAYEIKIWAQAKIGKIGDMQTAREIQTTPVILAINTDLEFAAQGRYFNDEGETLGFGPLPPRVNEVTGYHVFWTITNTLHELQNVKVVTTLPQDVIWTGRKQVGAGDLVFNEDARQVSWTINRIPTSINELTVNFEVSIKPDTDDVGTFKKLTTENVIEAKDQKTNDTLIISLDPILTDLPFDQLAKGRGVVMEAE